MLHSDASAEGSVAVTAARPSNAPALSSVLLLPPCGTPKGGPTLRGEQAWPVSAESTQRSPSRP
eukprot:429295-Pleurochrysis_carterae.AAC.1